MFWTFLLAPVFIIWVVWEFARGGELFDLGSRSIDDGQ